MSIHIVLAALLSVFLGFLFGITPGLNEHLHWSLWYLVPISGLLFGCLCAALQFWMCFSFHQRITKILIVYLTLATLAGYAAVDYGIYRSMKIEISGHEDLPDGKYKLKDLISFWQYMKWNLSSSTMTTDYGSETEYGALGTTVSYAADLAGAGLGSIGVLFVFMSKYPYCLRCRKYKKRQQQYVIQFVDTEELLKQILERFEQLKQAGNTGELIAYCQTLCAQHHEGKGTVRICIDHRICPSCQEVTLLGVVERRSGKDWNRVKELKFTYISGNRDPTSALCMNSEEKSRDPGVELS